MTPHAVHGPHAGVGWGEEDDGRPGRRWLVAAVLVAVLAALVPLASAPSAGPVTRWIVRSVDASASSVVQSIVRTGGPSALPLPLIDGVAVDLTSAEAARLDAMPGVVVTPDVPIGLSTFESGPPSDGGSLSRITDVIGATEYWRAGYTGEGVDVAVIDSGIAPVAGLDDPAKIIDGPDYSFDGIQPGLEHLDLFGHGTHMASIIGGSDLALDAVPSNKAKKDAFLGIAPGARLVNVKVADAQGVADVSQVIAGIGWVIDHRDDPAQDLDIRVLGLAFGTDSTQSPSIDPLAYAVEQAWNAGIVVVTSAGNDGNASPLRNPALHPKVIAVGAEDSHATRPTGDDTILDFSNCGTGRTVDLVAPGRSVLGLRVPGSFVDSEHPGAVVQDRLFRGSGTSQASAVVAGAAALVVDQRPDITPDEVKALLMGTAEPIAKASQECQGAGLVDLRAAIDAPTPVADQGPAVSDGSGSLEASRGSMHVVHDGVTLTGEQDIFGNEWDGASWSGASWSGASWSGASWSGASWSGASWSGASWSGASWSGASWSGASWSGASWSGASWSGASWSGASWSGASWSGASWSGASWSGSSWSTARWG